MMKTLATLFCAMLCVPSAFAEDAPPSAVVSEASVSLEDCKRIVKNDATYKPGVDVYGNAVVPADVEPAFGGMQIPDEIVIDFGFDFAGRYGFDGTGLHRATAGILTIEYDLVLGALTVNGKPLKQTDSRAVAKACTMMLKDARGAQ